MENRKSRKQFWRRAVIVAVGLLIILFAAVSGVEWWLAGKVRDFIGPFTSDVRHIGVSLLKRSVTISGLSIRTTDLQAVKRDTLLRSLDIGVEEIKVSGIGYARDGGRHKITLRRVELHAPRAAIERYDRSTLRGASADTIRKSLHDKLMTLFSSIEADQIRIDDGYLEFGLRKNDAIDRYTVTSLDLRGEGFRIDSTTHRNLFRVNALRTSAQEASVLYRDETMRLQASGIALDTRDSTFTVGGLGLEPQKYEKYQFASRVKNHPDWTRITTGGIRARGIDFGRWMDEQRIEVGVISVDSARIESFKNRRIDQPPRIKPLAWVLLHDVGIPFRVGRIDLRNLFAAYEELSATGVEPGRVTFEQLNGSAEGVTNVSGGEPYMTVRAGCKLQGVADLQAEFRLPTDPERDAFTVEGRLGAMNLAEMNRVIEPLSRVRIKSGRVNDLTFSIRGTSREAWTEMQFRYDGLEIAVMRGGGRDAHERALLSAFANKVLIRSANPDSHGKLHTGSGSFTRDVHRSQFNFLWKTLFAGIRDTALTQ